MKIIKASCILDFYVSKKKYKSYKKELSRKKYVISMVREYLESLVGETHSGVLIIYCTLSSNSAWSEDLLTIIPDLEYSFYNQVALRNDDKLALRQFQVDLIGVEVGINERDRFEDIKKDNFILSATSVIII